MVSIDTIHLIDVVCSNGYDINKKEKVQLVQANRLQTTDEYFSQDWYNYVTIERKDLRKELILKAMLPL